MIFKEKNGNEINKEFISEVTFIVSGFASIV